MAALDTTLRVRGQPPARPPALAPLVSGGYRLRLVDDEEALDAVLRLRFRVFNLELGEGLASSEATGRDEDRFDGQCHHLLVEDLATGEAIGTYRMQTQAMAAAGHGFYSAGEYELEALPAAVLAAAVELGRACIDREHRSRAVLFLLWLGLARYLEAVGGRYLFGCCSLTSQDPAVGLAAASRLAREGHRHPTLWVPPRPGCECRGGEEAMPLSACAKRPNEQCPSRGEAEPLPAVELPVLFRTYLRYGAQVISPPAIDRDFKTIDFLVLLDAESLDRRRRERFLAAAP